MIRINLLGGPREVVAVAPEGAPGISSAAIVAAVVALVVFGGGVGAAYVYLAHEVSVERTKIDSLSREYQRLQGIKQQADQYLQEKNQYQQRIDTIHGLQQSAKGPVALMESVGYEADRTNDLFLESISTSGDKLSVKGTSTSITSLANFLGSLDKNNNFANVMLNTAYEDDLFKRTAYKFAVDCEFRPPAVQSGTAPSTGQPAATAGGRATKPGM